jgi:tRNA(fMet)-specific endonuclease VapC
VLYLVDTDWVIDYMHGVPRLVERFDRLLPDGVGLSIVSLAELYDGVLGSSAPRRNEQKLRSFLAFVDVVPLDDAVCRIFAGERSRLRAEGTLIGDFDLLIGATSVSHGLTLLTNNRRHFERVRGVNILSA